MRIKLKIIVTAPKIGCKIGKFSNSPYVYASEINMDSLVYSLEVIGSVLVAKERHRVG